MLANEAKMNQTKGPTGWGFEQLLFRFFLFVWAFGLDYTRNRES